MPARFWIKSITFNDGTTVELKSDSIVIIVGANNCGKSQVLRDIEHLVAVLTNPQIVVRKIEVAREGSPQEALETLARTARRRQMADGIYYDALGLRLREDQIAKHWGRSDGLRDAARWFCRSLQTESRLQASQAPPNIKIREEQPSHPIHYLQLDYELERTVVSGRI